MEDIKILVSLFFAARIMLHTVLMIYQFMQSHLAKESIEMSENVSEDVLWHYTKCSL
jgi:hypothetical protein